MRKRGLEQRLRGHASWPASRSRCPDRKREHPVETPSDGECVRYVWGRADRIHNAPRDPERVIRRAAGRVFHAGAARHRLRCWAVPTVWERAFQERWVTLSPRRVASARPARSAAPAVPPTSGTIGPPRSIVKLWISVHPAGASICHDAPSVGSGHGRQSQREGSENGGYSQEDHVVAKRG